MDIPATVTSKGQITIPIQVRRALNLGTGDRVIFRLDNGHATFEADHTEGRGLVGEIAKPPDFFELAASVPTPPELRNVSWEEVRQRAWSDAAAQP